MTFSSLQVNHIKLVYEYCVDPRDGTVDEVISDEEIQVAIQESVIGRANRKTSRTTLDAERYISHLAQRKKGLYAQLLAYELHALSAPAEEQARLKEGLLSDLKPRIHHQVTLVAFQNWSYVNTPERVRNRTDLNFTAIFVWREWTKRHADMPKEETLDPAMKIPFWYGNYIAKLNPFKKDEVLKRSTITWGELQKILGQRTPLDKTYGFLPEPVQDVKYIEPPKDKDEGKKSS